MKYTTPLDILYEDNAIIVCVKPAGLPVQTARTGQKDLVSELKNYRARKREEPYIGLVHRLDQPVCGVMLFAKTKKAAAHLSRQIRSRQIAKEYMAVVCGLPDSASRTDSLMNHQSSSAASDTPPTLPQTGELHDYLLRDGKTNTSRVVSEGTPGAKEAFLSYEIVKHNAESCRSLVHITLHTGRHHQIRVQFAHAGFPLYADAKYGQQLHGGSCCPIALCAYKISFSHPENGKEMSFMTEDFRQFPL